MNHIRIIFSTLCFWVLLLTAQAQDAIFHKYEDTKGVSTVFISKTMLRMMSNSNIGNIKITSVAGKLDGMRILNCDKPALATQIGQDIKRMLKTEGFEVVMQINDDGEKTIIYQKELSKGRNTFSLLNDEKDEISFISISGAVTLNDISKIIRK